MGHGLEVHRTLADVMIDVANVHGLATRAAMSDAVWMKRHRPSTLLDFYSSSYQSDGSLRTLAEHRSLFQPLPKSADAFRSTMTSHNPSPYLHLLSLCS